MRVVTCGPFAYDAAATDELLPDDPLLDEPPDEDPDPVEPDPEEPLPEADPTEASLFEPPASLLASELPEEPLAEPTFALRPSERLSVL